MKLLQGSANPSDNPNINSNCRNGSFGQNLVLEMSIVNRCLYICSEKRQKIMIILPPLYKTRKEEGMSTTVISLGVCKIKPIHCSGEKLNLRPFGIGGGSAMFVSQARIH